MSGITPVASSTASRLDFLATILVGVLVVVILGLLSIVIYRRIRSRQARR